MFRASARKRRVQLAQLFTCEPLSWSQGAYEKAVRQLEDLVEGCLHIHESNLKNMEWDFQYYGASFFHFNKVTGDVALITLVKRGTECWP